MQLLQVTPPCRAQGLGPGGSVICSWSSWSLHAAAALAAKVNMSKPLQHSQAPLQTHPNTLAKPQARSVIQQLAEISTGVPRAKPNATCYKALLDQFWLLTLVSNHWWVNLVQACWVLDEALMACAGLPLCCITSSQELWKDSKSQWLIWEQSCASSCPAPAELQHGFIKELRPSCGLIWEAGKGQSLLTCAPGQWQRNQGKLQPLYTPRRSSRGNDLNSCQIPCTGQSLWKTVESFVTAAQQILTQPLPGRAHYGRIISCLSQLLCLLLLSPVLQSCSGLCLLWCFDDPRSNLEESSHYYLWASQLPLGKQPTHQGSWHRCKLAMLLEYKKQKTPICLPRQSERSPWSSLPCLLHASISKLTSTQVARYSPSSTMSNAETQTRILMWKIPVMYVPEILLSSKAKQVLLWWLQRESLHKSPSSYILYFIFWVEWPSLS